MGKERDSSFELLRIISMFLIVMHHYAVHGDFDFMSPFSSRLYFVQCLAMGGKIGVNLFVLISGYFLCKTDFKWEKIIKLELEVIFYSLIIGLIFYVFFPERQSLKNVIGDLLVPFSGGRYWFYSTYFVLFLLSPFINKFISAIRKEDFKKILILLLVLWVVIPFLPKLISIEMSELCWFIFLYLVAAYLRFFCEDFTKKPEIYILLGIASYFLILLSVLAFDVLGFINFRFREYFSYFSPMNSVFVFASSVLLLIGFSKINIGSKKSINILSSTTFGIYLLHDNRLSSPFIWTDLCKNSTYFDSNTIFIHAFVTILSVYLCCAIIDLIRQFLFEKPLFWCVYKINERIKSRLNKD